MGNFQLNNNKKFVEKNCEVLVENKLENHDYFGRTQCMIPVKIQSTNCDLGQSVKVKID